MIGEIELENKVLKKVLGVNAEELTNYYQTVALASRMNGMVGMNGHFANGIAAIFAACGQDLAQVVNSSVGDVHFEVNQNGNLYCVIRLPSLLIGTVGGGTHLPSQSQCLKIMECEGKGHARKFAEIITATLLSGEISIAASLVKGNFLTLHKLSNIKTKNKLSGK